MEVKFSWKRLLITVGIVVLAAGAVGGTTWYLMDKQAREDVAAKEAEIEELQAKITKNDDSEKTEEVVGDTVKSEVLNWKNYFTINYPSDWAVRNNGVEGASVGSAPSPLSSLSLTRGKSYISFYVNPGGFGFECANPTIQYKTTITNKKVTLSNRQFNQASAEDLKLTGPSCGYALTTSFDYGKNNYFILASGEESSMQKDEPIIKQIISSITLK